MQKQNINLTLCQKNLYIKKTVSDKLTMNATPPLFTQDAPV